MGEAFHFLISVSLQSIGCPWVGNAGEISVIRLTRKVFLDLAIWMVGLGLLVGVVFPFFVMLFDVPASIAFSAAFVGCCLCAGFIVAIANYGLARGTVGSRLRLLAHHMKLAEVRILARGSGAEDGTCVKSECVIDVDSEDEIGESALAFSHLIEALIESKQIEDSFRVFTQVLSSSLEINVLASNALKHLQEHMDADAGALLLAGEGVLRIVESNGLKSTEGLEENEKIRQAMNLGKRVLVEIPEGVSVDGVLTSFRPREILVEPIVDRGESLGVIVLASVSGFDENDLPRLDLLRRSLGLAINNATAHENLQRLAALDPLTSIYNRRFGIRRLHEEFGRAVRAKAPLGVLLLDIDHFKKVNDTYGHLVGDRVILAVCDAARAVIREGDVLVRYGGEEFLLVTPAASVQDTRLIGERLRRTVEETVVHDGQQRIQVTISVGTAAFPDIEAEGETDLIKAADDALYKAKESGRNRVVAAA